MNKHGFLLAWVIAVTLASMALASMALAQTAAQRGGGRSSSPSGAGGFGGGDFFGGRGGPPGPGAAAPRPEKVAETLTQAYEQYTETSLAGVPKRDIQFVNATAAVPTK